MSKIRFKKSTTAPDSPPAGYVWAYIATDGSLKTKDEAGSVNDLTTGGPAKKLQNYVNDAAYVSANGAAVAGDIYWNTTDSKIRTHNGTAWEDLAGGGGATNAISQLDSSITVTDSGSNGNALVKIDNNPAMEINYAYSAVRHPTAPKLVIQKDTYEVGDLRFHTGDHLLLTSSVNGSNLKLDTNNGAIDVSTNKIINVADPTANQDAATKKYVDDETIKRAPVKTPIPTYSASATYAIGDQVVEADRIYKCTTAITTGEAFTIGKWTEISSSGVSSKIQVGDSKVEITDTGSDGAVVITTDNAEALRADKDKITITHASIPKLDAFKGGTKVGTMYGFAGTNDFAVQAPAGVLYLDAPNGIDVQAKKISDLGDPTGNQDAATKKYVDDEAAKKAPVKVPIPAYSASATYAIGDQVVQADKLYRCTTAITTGEAFTIGKWAEISPVSAADSIIVGDTSVVITDTGSDGSILAKVDNNPALEINKTYAAVRHATAPELVIQKGAFAIGDIKTVGDNFLITAETAGANLKLDTNTGAIDASSNKIINVAEPTANQDAATKKYIDDETAKRAPVKVPIPAYSASATYAIGDQVVQADKLYRCTTAIGTPEAFNGSNWQEISATSFTIDATVQDGSNNPPTGNAVYDELVLKASAKSPIPAYSASATYAIGDQVVEADKFYRCSTAITVAEAFNASKWTEISASSGTPDTIAVGDSKVQVTDTGSDGKVAIIADNVEGLSVTSTKTIVSHTTDPNLEINKNGTAIGEVKSTGNSLLIESKVSGEDIRFSTNSGQINFNSHKLVSVADPTANQDASTKKYVDDQCDLRANATSPISAYSASSNYILGAQVIYDDKLWKCSIAITTPEAWNAGKWTEISAGVAIDATVQDGSNNPPTGNAVYDELVLKAPAKSPIPAYSASSTYAIGDQVVQADKIYKCTTAITTGEVFTIGKWTEISAGSSDNIQNATGYSAVTCSGDTQVDIKLNNALGAFFISSAGRYSLAIRNAAGDPSAYLYGATASLSSELILNEASANGANSVQIKPPTALAANWSLTLPADDGAEGQALVTDGNGVSSWSSLVNNAITDGNTTTAPSEDAVHDALAGKAAAQAPLQVYNAGVSYVIGDQVIESDKIYRCTTGTTGAFNITHWTEVSAGSADTTKILTANGNAQVICSNDTQVDVKLNNTFSSAFIFSGGRHSLAVRDHAGDASAFVYGATAALPSSIQLNEAKDNGTNSITINPPAILAANWEMTLPVNNGDAGQALITDGNGVTSWGAVATVNDDIADGNTTTAPSENAVFDALALKAAKNKPLQAYSASSTYGTGDQVFYDDHFYRCVTAITTPEAWNGVKWAIISPPVSVTDALTSASTVNALSANQGKILNEGKAPIKTPIPLYSASSTYAVGDEVIEGTGLYKCKTAITVAEAFTVAKWDAIGGGTINDSITDGNTDSAPSENAVFDALALKASAKAPIPAYSASATYAIGDEVIEGTDLYKCKTAITVGEAFTIGKWDKIGATINDSISDGNTDSAPSENAVFDALAAKDDIKTQATGGASSFQMKFWKGTQAQYDSIGTKDANTVYYIV